MKLLMTEKDELEYLSHLKAIIIGGEALPAALIRELKKYTYAKIYNLYGPTETTVWSTLSSITSEDITIGRPIANTLVYILDKHLKPVPVGVPGDIYIGGDGLSCGYHDNPALTSEKFIQNPFMDNGKIYKTGDIGYWRGNGEIVCVGRNDFQIKLRGLRIELSEIELRLMMHESVKSAVVKGINEQDSIGYLCAYIIPGDGYDEHQLRAYLSQYLPEYMIPSYFVTLDRFPMTVNDKVDRNALPLPGVILAEYVPPADECESELAAIWAEALGVERVGVLDEFASLGGDSLKAIMIVMGINKRWGTNVAAKDVFNTKNVRELAGLIRKSSGAGYTPIPKAAEAAWYPVSAAQRRQYVEYHLYGGASFHIISGNIVSGAFDKNKFRDAFRILVQRQESLRTSFEMRDGVLVQIVHENVDFTIEEEDTDETDIDKLMTEFIRPFDLSKAPLFRVKIIRFSEEKHLLMLDMHHIISDGASLNILIREIAEILRGGQLPGLKIQYKDFAVWSGDYLKSEEMQKQEAYWLNHLAGELPVLNMPTDYARPPVKDLKGSRIYFSLNNKLTKELKSLAAETETTLFMVLMSAYVVLLSKYTGQEDIIIGMTVAGRQHPDLRDIIGMFVNTPVARCFPSAKKAFMKLLKEVKEELLSTYENQDYQYEELVERLGLKRDQSRYLLFDTLFTMFNADTSKLETDKYKMELYNYDPGTSKTDLSIAASDNGGTILCFLSYCTALFKTDKMEQLAKNYEKVLWEIVRNPSRKIADFNLVSVDSCLPSMKLQKLRKS